MAGKQLVRLGQHLNLLCTNLKNLPYTKYKIMRVEVVSCLPEVYYLSNLESALLLFGWYTICYSICFIVE